MKGAYIGMSNLTAKFQKMSQQLEDEKVINISTGDVTRLASSQLHLASQRLPCTSTTTTEASSSWYFCSAGYA